MNLSALAASKKATPANEVIGTTIQALEAKIDNLQQRLDSVSAQLLKACNDVSNSCIEQNNLTEEPREDITKPTTELLPKKK